MISVRILFHFIPFLYKYIIYKGGVQEPAAVVAPAVAWARLEAEEDLSSRSL